LLLLVSTMVEFFEGLADDAEAPVFTGLTGKTLEWVLDRLGWGDTPLGPDRIRVRKKIGYFLEHGAWKPGEEEGGGWVKVGRGQANLSPSFRQLFPFRQVSTCFDMVSTIFRQIRFSYFKLKSQGVIFFSKT
jgi:hypothetical protein